MPHIIVRLWPGKSEPRKTRQAEEIKGLIPTRSFMKPLTTLLISLSLISSADAQPNQSGNKKLQAIAIARNGSQSSTQGQADYFTGSVRIDPLFSVAEPARGSGARVTFEPGARTAWHAHPLGQTLIVTAGTGWVQQQGGRVEEIREGDVVQIPAGMKHWHGATATTRMTHIAIHEHLNGKVVEWMEKVSDAQYRRQ